jgi:hypothetical protein
VLAHFGRTYGERLQQISSRLGQADSAVLAVDDHDLPFVMRSDVRLAMNAMIRPVTSRRNPLGRRNHRGVANDRDEIAVASRFHPDRAGAVLGILVG